MPPIIPNGQFMDTSGSQMKPINPIPGPQMNSIRKPMQSSQINSANAPPVASLQMNPINTPITNFQMANLQMNQINHMPLVPLPNRKHHQMVQRRQEIVKLLKNVVFTGSPKATKINVPFTININDPIFRFLDCCESFKNPPPQPSDNKKYDILLKLKQEASILNELHRGIVEPRHILDVRGAEERKLGNYPLFKCSMCPSNSKEVKVYRKIVKHIMAVHGLDIESQRLSSYIEVDPKSVVNYIHFAFIPEIRPLEIRPKITK
ncbi:20929_t:CDS:2 [Racocetra persica]|uniref:20929_t:CDS:1 n=1 Tax=Racocetra persica TaxID=160502 RepID=A0ACA9MRK8_9GLOM|nr:20929_t:CDS:2 [Racocetra persica]